VKFNPVTEGLNRGLFLPYPFQLITDAVYGLLRDENKS